MTITKSIKEHIRVTGRMDEVKNIIAYCHKHNYQITRSGPRRFNCLKCLVVGEKEIQK